MINKQLARISHATLDISHNGILTFWIYVDYEDGGSQGIGGYSLCNPNPGGKLDRIGTAYGCEIIRRLLTALEVNDFSKMAGRNIWVLGTGKGFAFKPVGIQKLRNDNGDPEPVVFDEILAQFKGEKC